MFDPTSPLDWLAEIPVRIFRSGSAAWLKLRAQVALDVASGMEYLHTAFERDGHDQPLIHRDLKSPNLLLATAPRALQPGEPVLVKVTDFGLAKDKSFDAQNQQTAMMTGCGSVLWMAPEMLLGKRFNELIDVYSFAMCVSLLLICLHQLPGSWTDCQSPTLWTERCVAGCARAGAWSRWSTAGCPGRVALCQSELSLCRSPRASDRSTSCRAAPKGWRP
eukprot:COSAG01_NODE_4271_length_5194_cov_4.338567_2_plen_220_part_00